MAKETRSDELSDKAAEERANDALRRALTTAYKPQSDLKIGKKKKKPPTPRKPRVTTDPSS